MLEKSAGRAKRVVLPARSPILNADGERWVRSVSIKDEALSRPILLGEDSLRRVLKEYVDHYHHKRNHQGKGDVLLFPSFSQKSKGEGSIRHRDRRGGLLKYYERKAALVL
jgi:putative transposase